MPMISYGDMYPDSYPHTTILHVITAVVLVGGGILAWIYGFFESKSKAKYVKNSLFDFIGIIIGSILFSIWSIFFYFISVLGFADTKDEKTPGGVVIFFRIFFIIAIFSLILFLINLN